MTAFNAALALAAGAVLLLGLFAGYVKNRLWVAESTLCLLLGAAVGPFILGLADPTEIQPDSQFVVKEVARITLGIAVMGAALRLPGGYVTRHWRTLALVLGVGMPLMWLSGAGLAMLILGESALAALVIGAVMAPTDPVVAGAISAGRLAEANLPRRLRDLLTAESGANDGLGLMLVLLPVLLIEHSPATALTDWLFRVALWEIGGAIVIGLSVGWFSGRLLLWARNHPLSEHHSTVTVGLALTLTVLASVKLVGSDGILAVFAAGLMLNRFISREQTRHEHLQEAIGRFFDLPVFILVGLVLPWQEWFALGWRGLAFVIAILMLRRLPWWLGLWRGTSEIRTPREAAFLGWFGPIGVSTVYYAILAQEQTGLGQVWPIASLAVFTSVVVHGVTATPFAAMLDGRPVTSGPTHAADAKRR